MRERFCKVCRDWHNMAEPWPEACMGHFQTTPHTATVHIIGDTMAAARHPATGRVTDSKSAFRRDTKASGCVEVGNEPIREQRIAPRMSDPRAEIARRLERY